VPTEIAREKFVMLEGLFRAVAFTFVRLLFGPNPDWDSSARRLCVNPLAVWAKLKEATIFTEIQCPGEKIFVRQTVCNEEFCMVGKSKVYGNYNSSARKQTIDSGYLCGFVMGWVRKIYGLLNRLVIHIEFLATQWSSHGVSKAKTNFGHCVEFVLLFDLLFHSHSPLKVNEMWTGDGRRYEITEAINGNDGFIGLKDTEIYVHP